VRDSLPSFHVKVNAWVIAVTRKVTPFCSFGPASVIYGRIAHDCREADVKRSWYGVVAVGVLTAACAEPDALPPAVPSAAPPATVMAATDTGALPQGGVSLVPSGPVVGNMPPSAMNANPPGTPSYVIHPGDPAGRQVPRPGGAPAF
jgi:hypothetical protein